jgi:hypothetical protein
VRCRRRVGEKGGGAARGDGRDELRVDVDVDVEDAPRDRSGRTPTPRSRSRSRSRAFLRSGRACSRGRPSARAGTSSSPRWRRPRGRAGSSCRLRRACRRHPRGALAAACQGERRLRCRRRAWWKTAERRRPGLGHGHRARRELLAHLPRPVHGAGPRHADPDAVTLPGADRRHRVAVGVAAGNGEDRAPAESAEHPCQQQLVVLPHAGPWWRRSKASVSRGVDSKKATRLPESSLFGLAGARLSTSARPREPADVVPARPIPPPATSCPPEARAPPPWRSPPRP